MKNLFQYIEEMEGAATPGNTVGMGNPMLPTAEEPGTEPLCATAKCKKEKKKKIKESLLDDEDDLLNGDPAEIKRRQAAQWIKDHLMKGYAIMNLEWILDHLTWNEKDGKELVWNDDFDHHADDFLHIEMDEDQLPFKFESCCGNFHIKFKKAKAIDFTNLPFTFHGGHNGVLTIEAPQATKMVNTDQACLICQNVILIAPKLKDLNWPAWGDVMNFDLSKCKMLETITSAPTIVGKSNAMIIPKDLVINMLKKYNIKLASTPIKIK